MGMLALCAAGRLLAAEVDESKLPPPATVQIDFARDIKPILTNNCYKCHAGEKPKSHFLLTTREAALKGGDQGVDILPKQSAKSPLIHYVSRLVADMEMPPEGRGTPLTNEQIGLLRAWIDQGVPWGQVEPEKKTEFTASPTVGWTTVSGDEKKFRELYWQREGWNGGLEEFELKQKLGPDSKFAASGHVLLDDYKLTLGAEKNDLGFTHFGWSQFRKYYDDSGGYYPLFSPPIFNLNRDLYLDTGQAWADIGLTLPRWPRLTLGYEYQYRDGSKSTLQWGPVSDGTQTRNIYPASKDISEKVNILKFDLDYEVSGLLLTDNFRGEWYDLTTRRQNDAFYTLGTPGIATTIAAEKQGHFQGANTFHLEKQLTGWLFASGGYLYSKFNGDGSLDVQTLAAGYLNAIPSDPGSSVPGWHTQGIELERESHVFSVSYLLGPWQGLSLSLGSQNEWTRQSGFAGANVDLASLKGPFTPVLTDLGSELNQSQSDRSTFSQDVSLRFTKIPFTTLFAEARFQQDSIGQSQEQAGNLTPFLLDTDATSKLTDFRLGFNTSPWRSVSLSGHYRQYDKTTDYNNYPKGFVGDPYAGYEGYPGFITWRDVFSQEAQAKLSLQPVVWLKTTLSYQWLANHYQTATDPVLTDPNTGQPSDISRGGSLLAGTYDAQILSLSGTLTRWRRLFLSATFAYQHAKTATAANDSPSVAPYEGDIYSAIATASYVLNDKTDLVGSYSFSHADFAQNNFAAGLPLGINYQQHGLQAGIKRRFGKGKTLGLQYRYYHYDEPSSGGFNNFDAQAVFATLTFRLP